MIKEKLKQTKGITLIALIITIVIMLILVAVGVKVAIDGQLIGIAEETANRTNNKVNKLQNRVNEVSGDVLDAYQWACEHEFGEWVVIKEATETEDGSSERECTKCGYIETKIIPATSSELTEEPTEIALSYSTPLTTWTNEEVVVTASLGNSGEVAQINQSLIKRVSYTEANDNIVLANNTGYTIQMSKDKTNWETTNSLTYTENGAVYARVMKNGSQVGEIKEGEVTNIDKTLPTRGRLSDGTNYLSSDAENVYASSVTLSIEDGSDLESGHKSTTYAIYYVEDNTNVVEQCYNDQEMEMDFDPYNLTRDVSISWMWGPEVLSSLTEKNTKNHIKIGDNGFEGMV